MSILTVADAIAVGVIVSAAGRKNPVAWLDKESGNVIFGTARSIGNQVGSFLTENEDVREGYLRVTTKQGMEVFLRIADLIDQYHEDTFIVHYED